MRVEEAPTLNSPALMSHRIDEYFITFHPEYLEGFSFQEKRRMQIHSNAQWGTQLVQNELWTWSFTSKFQWCSWTKDTAKLMRSHLCA